MQMADLNVNDTINDISRVIRRMVGDDIHLKLDLASDVPTVRADRAMLEQVLMNLASNARDAMPRGGTLTVQTRMMTLEESYFGGEKIPAGTYARLSVADTGFGISPEHLPRIFEPFFTTKSVGQGSGLGLATVYGAIKQHQGAIKVETTPGRGTTFTMLFPIAKQKKQVTNELKTSISGRRIAGGAETILVVEDDAAILQMVRALLAGYGYRVLEASSALDALGIWRSQKGKINLLLTDVVMGGGFAGRELAAKLREDEPNLKVIFTSGYADVPERDAALKDAPNFIAKPYHPAKLAQAVRSILDN
jgi:CheY-like chemotaxis protein